MKIEPKSFHPNYSTQELHVGIIPDGTRRWAKNNNVPLQKAYEKSMNILSKIISELFTSGVKYVSVYLASIYNFQRSVNEIDAFCRAETYFCNKLLPEMLGNQDINIKSVGRKEILPKYFQDAILQIENKNRGLSSNVLFLLIAYDAISELVKAIDRSSRVENFVDYLDVNKPLDLVIRTSGTNLLSNFLPLQSGYARFYTLNELFNDTKPNDYLDIIIQYKGLKRLYGE